MTNMELEYKLPEFKDDHGMYRFLMVRDQDVTGVSGTGVVAEGCVLSSGQVVIHWFGERQSIVIWNSIADAVAIHGHVGKTRFEWIDAGGVLLDYNEEGS